MDGNFLKNHWFFNRSFDFDAPLDLKYIEPYTTTHSIFMKKTNKNPDSLAVNDYYNFYDRHSDRVTWRLYD